MPVNKLFLDTNILLDYLLARSGELKQVEKIMDLAHGGKLQCFISESVIATAIYFLEKEKLDALAMIRRTCEVVKILSFQQDVLDLPIEKFKDTEDGLLYYLAKFHQLDYFITRNTNDFKKASGHLQVLTPKHFLTSIYKDDFF